MMDLPITLAILFEHTMEEFQFWETFLVANATSSVYHNGQNRILTSWVVVGVSI